MVVAIANKAGGINGQPIEIQIVDDQSNPRVAVLLANEIMAHHPAVILGPTIQATCNAVGPRWPTAGPVVYCQSPGLNPPKDSFVFSSGVAITRTIPIAVRFARLSGARRMAFLIANDATGARPGAIARHRGGRTGEPQRAGRGARALRGQRARHRSAARAYQGRQRRLPLRLRGRYAVPDGDPRPARRRA